MPGALVPKKLITAKICMEKDEIHSSIYFLWKLLKISQLKKTMLFI